jgi:putative membrane protein insertion efficiency factor
MIEGVCQKMLLVALTGYKVMISPWLGPACRFTPTCSEYASDAIGRYGVVRGAGKAFMRLLRCHPFCRGGWDPA